MPTQNFAGPERDHRALYSTDTDATIVEEHSRYWFELDNDFFDITRPLITANNTYVWFGGLFILKVAPASGKHIRLFTVSTDASGDESIVSLQIHDNGGTPRLEIRDNAETLIAAGSDIAVGDVHWFYWSPWDTSNANVYLDGSLDITWATSNRPDADSPGLRLRIGGGDDASARLLMRNVFRHTSTVDQLNEATYKPECKAMTPDGNGNYTDWTGDYADADDYATAETPDNDTTYVSEGNNANQRESFTMSNPGLVNTDFIAAVAERIWVRAEDGGKAVSVSGFLRESATDTSDQTLAAPDTSYILGRPGMFSTKPSTGFWTEAALNGTEGAIHRTNDGATTIRCSALLCEVLSFGSEDDWEVATGASRRRVLHQVVG